MNGLMAEVIEGHVWFQVISPDNSKTSPQARAGQQLIAIVRACLK